MTPKEASKIIDNFYSCIVLPRCNGKLYSHRRLDEAVKMAIEALKEWKERGVWIRTENPTYSPFDNSKPYIYQCSICLNKFNRSEKYCPQCGARMRDVLTEDPSHPFAEDVMMEK